MSTSTTSTSAKLQEFITSKTMESLANAKDETTQKAEVKKSRAKKTNSNTVAKAVKVAKSQAANNLVEEVISNREVKYIYPEDCQDTLSRKKWRQKVRNELKKLETTMLRIEDKNSKEFKKAEKEFISAKKKYMKVGTKVA